MNLNIPRLDLDAEISGVWFTYRGRIRAKIARMNNPNYAAALLEYYDLYGERLKEDKLAADEATAALNLIYARYILMDWEGVVDKDTGEPVPYTEDAGLSVLSDPQMKDFKLFVLSKSRSDMENWEVKTQEVGEE